MEEEQVRREVWEGTVAVSFLLAEDEVGFNKSNIPEACYVSGRAQCQLARC